MRLTSSWLYPRWAKMASGEAAAAHRSPEELETLISGEWRDLSNARIFYVTRSDVRSMVISLPIVLFFTFDCLAFIYFQYYCLSFRNKLLFVISGTIFRV